MERLQTGRMIQKLPRHFELPGKLRRQRLHPEGFRGVVAGVKNIQAEFLGERIRPVRPFAGDERVHAFRRRELQIAARPAGDHADPPADFPAAGNYLWFGTGHAFQPPAEFGAGDFGWRLEADGLPVTGEKGLQIFEAESGTQPGECPPESARDSLNLIQQAVLSADSGQVINL